MKKLISLLLFLSMLLCTACTSEVNVPTTETTTAPIQTVPTQPVETTAPTMQFQAPLSALSAPVSTQVYTDNGDTVFTYTYQDISLTLQDPQVAEAIIIDFLNVVDFDNSSAPRILAEALQADRTSGDWIPYSYTVTFNPFRFDSSILSLHGTQTVYNGNPRPSMTDISVSYDLLTGRRLALQDVLAEDYSADTLSALIVQALSGPAAEGILFSDYAHVVSEMFASNTPVQSWYFSGSGLCFYFAPYEIAPFSAGTVVAEVPYSDLIGLLKDEYFPEESVILSGDINVENFEDVDHSAFALFAELILDPSGSEYFLYPSGAVRNVRLELDGSCIDESLTGTQITVFAAATLCSTDALMLQASPELLEHLTLCYEADGNSVSVQLSLLIP